VIGEMKIEKLTSFNMLWIKSQRTPGILSWDHNLTSLSS